MPCCYFSNDFRRRRVFGFSRWGKKKLYSVGILPPKVKCKWKAAVVLLLFCLFLGQDSDFEDLLTSSSISTLLDAQGFSDLEKSLSPTPVMGSPSRDPFNTSVPEEVFTESQFFAEIHIADNMKRLCHRRLRCCWQHERHGIFSQFDYWLSFGNLCVS